MGTETTGKLHAIFETKQVSERFTKREFVLELADNPKYPQRVLFQITGDRVTQLDEFRVGDTVRVEYSLRGREWNSPQGETKYFNSLDVWKVEAATAGRSNNRGDDRGERTYDRGNSYDRGNGGGAEFRGGGPRGNSGRPPAREDSPPPAYDPRPSDSGNADLDDLPF